MGSSFTAGEQWGRDALPLHSLSFPPLFPHRPRSLRPTGRREASGGGVEEVAGRREGDATACGIRREGDAAACGIRREGDAAACGIRRAPSLFWRRLQRRRVSPSPPTLSSRGGGPEAVAEELARAGKGTTAGEVGLGELVPLPCSFPSAVEPREEGKGPRPSISTPSSSPVTSSSMREAAPGAAARRSAAGSGGRIHPAMASGHLLFLRRPYRAGVRPRRRRNRGGALLSSRRGRGGARPARRSSSDGGGAMEQGGEAGGAAGTSRGGVEGGDAAAEWREVTWRRVDLLRRRAPSLLLHRRAAGPGRPPPCSLNRAPPRQRSGGR
ncbi:unnamed protein product [Urochloa humidicola]